MNKKTLIISISSFLVLTLLVTAYILGKNNDSVTPVNPNSQTTQTNTGVTPAAITGPFYEYEAKQLTEASKSDSFYLKCVSETATQCSKSASGTTLSFTGNFDAILQTMKSSPNKSQLDACFSDAIRNCVTIAVRAKSESNLDPSVCDVYQNINEKTSCKQEIYRKLALKNDDVSVCGNIEDGFQKNYCQDIYNIHKSETTEDVSWCDRIAEESQKNMCKSSLLNRIAVSTKKPEKCLGYLNDTEIDGCLMSYVNQTRRLSSSCAELDSIEKYFKDRKQLIFSKAQCKEQQALSSLLSKSTEINKIPFDSLLILCNEYPDSNSIKECKDRITAIINNQKKQFLTTLGENTRDISTGTGTGTNIQNIPVESEAIGNLGSFNNSGVTFPSPKQVIPK